jgi:hypothetical protein
MATGKKVYQGVTRGLFRFTDREGGGPRLVYDAPKIAARLREHAAVRDVAIVAFPDRRSGIGLYAFVEASPDVTERALRDFVGTTLGAAAPEHLQVTGALPRTLSGEVRNEILQLIAMNQVDQINSLIHDDIERATVARIVAERHNLRDRFAF